jgi:ABC-2 type transport system ATP-binding protein
MISIGCSNPRKLAEMLIAKDYVSTINFHPEEDKVTFNTQKRDLFFDMLTQVIVDQKLEVTEISSPDDNMQAVFDYLVGR